MIEQPEKKERKTMIEQPEKKERSDDNGGVARNFFSQVDRFAMSRVYIFMVFFVIMPLNGWLIAEYGSMYFFLIAMQLMWGYRVAVAAEKGA